MLGWRYSPMREWNSGRAADADVGAEEGAGIGAGGRFVVGALGRDVDVVHVRATEDQAGGPLDAGNLHAALLRPVRPVAGDATDAPQGGPHVALGVHGHAVGAEHVLVLRHVQEHLLPGKGASGLIVVEQVNLAPECIGKVHLPVVEREAHAVREADTFQHDRQGAVGIETVEARVVPVGRHGAAVDPAGRVGDHVVEPRPTLGRNLVNDRGESAVAQYLDGAAGHEEQERAIRLKGKPTNVFLALVEQLVVTRGGMIAEDTAGGDIYPIDALLGDVPERAFTGFFLVVGNQLRCHCMPPPA